MALEIRNEYAIYHMGKCVGYVIRKDDPMNYWLAQDFKDAEWVVRKSRIDFEQAVASGLLRRAAPELATARQ